MSKRIFYIHIKNNVDRRDDDFYKVRSSSKDTARNYAENHKGGNTRSVGGVYSPAEFRRHYPWWAKFLRRDTGRDI